MDFVRLLAAGLLSFLGLLLSATAVVSTLPAKTPSLLVGFILVLIYVVFFVVIAAVFNLARGKPSPGPDVAALDAQGLVTSAEYRALRAFAVEEFEDEGGHYFVELADGGVLYLNGQYLDDHDMEAAARENRPCLGFPNRDFTVLRHRTEGQVLDIVCRGESFKPELILPPFKEEWFNSGQAPADGELIRDRSYDALKAECLAAAGR